MDAMHGELYISCKWPVIVAVSVTTVLIGTFSNTRRADLKDWSCCGSVENDFSQARFTV